MRLPATPRHALPQLDLRQLGLSQTATDAQHGQMSDEHDRVALPPLRLQYAVEPSVNVIIRIIQRLPKGSNVRYGRVFPLDPVSEMRVSSSESA
jgi:hypothetical protein